jgi:N-ethylmaleimide reductase
MAPLTRLRSGQPGDIPGELMVEYYVQRAAPGGLIVTESTEITPEASAYEGAPGIYTEAQMAGWRQVVGAIQRKGGYVFLQLWHPGRVSHPDLTGVAPVSASATESSDILVFTNKGPLPAPRSRPLAEDDYVMVHSRYSGTGLAAAWIVIDIVRIQDGILAEHWDVIQDEATKEQSKSGSPMFGTSFPS